MRAMICSEKTGNLYYVINKDQLITNKSSNIEESAEFILVIDSRLKVLQDWLDSLRELPLARFMFTYRIFIDDDAEAIYVDGHKISGRTYRDAENHLIQLQKDCYPMQEVRVEVIGWIKL